MYRKKLFRITLPTTNSKVIDIREDVTVLQLRHGCSSQDNTLRDNISQDNFWQDSSHCFLYVGGNIGITLLVPVSRSVFKIFLFENQHLFSWLNGTSWWNLTNKVNRCNSHRQLGNLNIRYVVNNRHRIIFISRDSASILILIHQLGPCTHTASCNRHKY